MRRLALFVLALGLGALAPASARAETLVTSLSTHRLLINSNFTGSVIVLFGAIERDAQTVARAGGYHIAVVVRGPRATVVTRQKQVLFGLWVNGTSREFLETPSAYAVISNRPAAEIADIDQRRRHQIGLDSLILLQASRPGEEPEMGGAFREAFVRINQQRGLYRDDPTGVTFLTPNLFRATIPIQPNTPVGSFDVDIFLFSGGALLAREVTNFEVGKTGFEAFVANAARDHGLAYGLAAAALALMTGWFASVVFRRD